MKADFDVYKNELDEKGFVIIEEVFSNDGVNAIIDYIEIHETNSSSFRRSKDIFAIRKVLKEMPGLRNKIFTNTGIQSIIYTLFGPAYFLVKSLYFDKPSFSNWFVSYHQDLSVSAENKIDATGFTNWTVKDNQYGVQPPLSILENIYTIRLHLDDCNANNGALHVIPGSHKNGICRVQEADLRSMPVSVCAVPKGGVMIMRPLLLHASHKSTTDNKRRVLHFEFANTALAEQINWAEKEFII